MQIILGAGFSAFFSYFFLKKKYREIMVIGEPYSKFPYGVFLLRNRYLDTIFKHLKINYAYKKMKIGVKISENKIEELNWRNISLLKTYANKVRKNLLELNILNFINKERYIINRIKLIQKIYDFIGYNLYDTLKIEEININNSSVVVKNLAGFEKEIQFDFLVSTIPLPIFLKLSNINVEFEFLIKIPTIEKMDLNELSDWDVIYDSTNSDILRYFPSWNIIESQPIEIVDFFSVKRKGKILRDFDFSKLNLTNRIKFIGRFAKWKKSYTLIDSLFDSYKLMNKKY